MAENSNVLGVRNLFINDVSYDFEVGTVSTERGGDVLATAPNKPNKRTRTRTPAAIVATICLDCDQSLSDIQICGATVSVEYFDGRVHTIRNADFIGNAVFTGNSNSVAARFEGERLRERTFCAS